MPITGTMARKIRPTSTTGSSRAIGQPAALLVLRGRGLRPVHRSWAGPVSSSTIAARSVAVAAGSWCRSTSKSGDGAAHQASFQRCEGLRLDMLVFVGARWRLPTSRQGLCRRRCQARSARNSATLSCRPSRRRMATGSRRRSRTAATKIVSAKRSQKIPSDHRFDTARRRSPLNRSYSFRNSKIRSNSSQVLRSSRRSCRFSFSTHAVVAGSAAPAAPMTTGTFTRTSASTSPQVLPSDAFGRVTLEGSTR